MKSHNISRQDASEGMGKDLYDNFPKARDYFEYANNY